MNTVQSSDRMRHELLIALGVFLCSLLLILIDKDTHSWSDLFYPSNLVALLIYFTPTYILSCVLYRIFARNNSPKKSIWIALSLGVAAGFAIIILFFILVSH